MDNEIITIKGEDGEEYEMELYDFFEMEGKRYAVLVQVEEGDAGEETGENDDETVDAFIFRVEKDEQGEDIFVTIDDEEEFNSVVAQIEASEAE